MRHIWSPENLKKAFYSGIKCGLAIFLGNVVGAGAWEVTHLEKASGIGTPVMLGYAAYYFPLVLIYGLLVAAVVTPGPASLRRRIGRKTYIGFFIMGAVCWQLAPYLLVPFAKLLF